MKVSVNVRVIARAADWLRNYIDEDPHTEAAREAAIIAGMLDKEIAVKREANDYDEASLAAAAHNFDLLQPHWAHAKKCSSTDDNIVYYRDPRTGSHGWMCGECHRIVQTG